MNLFEERIARKPVRYTWAGEYISAIQAGFWTADEFSFIADLGQFKTALSEQEQQVVVRTLSAIGQIEIAVKTFWAKLGDNFPHPEISDLGYVMANSEVIHNLAYEKLLEVLGIVDVFEQNLKIPVFKARVEYLRKYAQRVYPHDQRKQYIYSLILFTLFVENASLFSQFYILMHLNRTRAVLKDTAQQVMYTRNEEDLHRLIGIRLINTLREELPELFDDELIARVKEETEEALKAEGAVIDWLLQGFEEEGLSAPLLKAFVKDRIIDSLKMIGFDTPVLNKEEEEVLVQTSWFNVSQHGTIMTDFFAQNPVEYNKHYRAFTREELWGPEDV